MTLISNGCEEPALLRVQDHYEASSLMVDAGEPGDVEIMPEHGKESRPWAHLLAGGYDTNFCA